MLQSENPTALQSQKWIVGAFIDLLNKQPYSEITITRICHQAKLDRRTFYRNFESKDDVLLTYMNQLRDEYRALLRSEEKLTPYIAATLFFEFWREHSAFLGIIQRDGFISLILNKYGDFLQDIFSLIHGSPDRAFDKYQLAFNIGGFFNVLVTWAAGNAEHTAEEMAGMVSRLIVRDSGLSQQS